MDMVLAIVFGLRMLWIGAVGTALVGLAPLGAFSGFVRDVSRRGKLKLATTADHPPRFSVPQRWFAHFYVLGCLVNSLLLSVAFLFAHFCTFLCNRRRLKFVPSLLGWENPVTSWMMRLPGRAVYWCLPGADTRDSIEVVGYVAHFVNCKGRAWSSCIVLSMLELQLLRRLSESIHLSHYSPLARMHVLGYLVGLGFYPAASLTLFSQHFQDREFLYLLCKFVVKRLGRDWTLQIGPLLNSQIELMGYAKSHKGLDAFQWAGLGVFLVGWIQQFRLHSLLASLRRKEVRAGFEVILKPCLSEDNRRADRYEIPRGSWFEWVSCAHYFAEVVLYGGIVLASDGHNLNIWLLFSWVVLNLTLAARDTHAWYRIKFEDYPPHRRAIFPFIY